MPFRYETRMPAANSVGKNQTITFNLPIGKRYHWLRLVGAGTAFTVAHLTEIRLFLNGKIFQRFSGTERDTMNKFDRISAAAIDANSFNLRIQFDRYGMRVRAAEEDTAVCTGSIDLKTGRQIAQFRVEIDVSNAPTAVTVLDMYAMQSAAPPADGSDPSDLPGPRKLPYILKSVRDYSAATTYEEASLPRGGITTQYFERAFLIPTTSTLENLKVYINQWLAFERTAALNIREQTDGVRTPQSGVYCIDPTEYGYADDIFPLVGVQDFRIRYDTGAAMTLTYLTQYIGDLDD